MGPSKIKNILPWIAKSNIFPAGLSRCCCWSCCCCCYCFCCMYLMMYLYNGTKWPPIIPWKFLIPGLTLASRARPAPGCVSAPALRHTCSTGQKICARLSDGAPAAFFRSTCPFWRSNLLFRASQGRPGPRFSSPNQLFFRDFCVQRTPDTQNVRHR